MTMPKFTPVAWRYELKAGEYTFAEKRYLNETYAPRPTALHTADQLTEAYEAGKMEQAEQINHLQMALADTEALESETSARCLKQAAQIDALTRELTKIMIEGGESAIARAERKLRYEALEQLAAAIAACKLKDEALKWLMDWQVKHVDVWDNPAFDNAEEALAIQPDDAAPKEGLGEPYTMEIPK